MWARARPVVNAFRLRAAAVAGSAVGTIGRGLPGMAGPLIVSIGLGMAWRPLGVVFFGAVVWALDRRV